MRSVVACSSPIIAIAMMIGIRAEVRAA